MPKFDTQHYWPVESYGEALEAFHVISGIILFEFARQDLDKRDIIIRNFVARTDMMVRGVFRLWDIQDYQDCWILQMFTGTPEQRERARILSGNRPNWQRPKAEEVAKRLKMGFLYRFGYDFGSTQVHPMADDGHQDFFTITKLEPVPDFPDQRSVLSNTLLVGAMIVQESLNASTLSWRAIVYDFLDDLRRFLDTGSDDYKLSFVKLTKLIELRTRLCETPDRSSNEESAI